MEEEYPYWFRAKRYGWGWGLPCAWQGWVVLLAWVAAFAGGELALARNGMQAHWAVPFALAMGLLLFLVCYAKGEPTRWRWGGED